MLYRVGAQPVTNVIKTPVDQQQQVKPSPQDTQRVPQAQGAPTAAFEQRGAQVLAGVTQAPAVADMVGQAARIASDFAAQRVERRAQRQESGSADVVDNEPLGIGYDVGTKVRSSANFMGGNKAGSRTASVFAAQQQNVVKKSDVGK